MASRAQVVPSQVRGLYTVEPWRLLLTYFFSFLIFFWSPHAFTHLLTHYSQYSRMFSQQINTTFDTSLLCPQRNRINSSSTSKPAQPTCPVLSWCQKCLAIRRPWSWGSWPKAQASLACWHIRLNVLNCLPSLLLLLLLLASKQSLVFYLYALSLSLLLSATRENLMPDAWCLMVDGFFFYVCLFACGSATSPLAFFLSFFFNTFLHCHT